MWGQRNSKFAAAIGTQLLAKIHLLSSKVEDASQIQNHPVNRLSEQCPDTNLSCPQLAFYFDFSFWVSLWSFYSNPRFPLLFANFPHLSDRPNRD